jgi:hypothetical protein
MTPSPRGGGTLDLLASRIHDVRELLQSVWTAADAPKIRDEMIDTVVKAITEANIIPGQAPESADKGRGGVPLRT